MVNNNFCSSASQERLVQRIASLEEYLFMHNKGNAGDSLIYAGMCDLLGCPKNGPQWFSEASFEHKQDIVFGGGGGFTELYSHCADFIRQYFDRFKTFTLLPSTISGNEELLSRMDERFYLFCRDEVSLAHCKRHCPESVTVLPHEDLAFSINLNRVENETSRIHPSISIHRNLKWIKRLSFCRQYVSAEKTNFFRTDCESARIPPQSNLDLSDFLPKRQRDHKETLFLATAFINILSKAKAVDTDRLHIAIAGSLLNKPTNLYAGSYYKNRAVYTATISNRFNNTKFIES